MYRFSLDCKTDDYGLLYNGTINKTVTGKSCQAWVSDVPHSHHFNHLERSVNYCRNPDWEVPGPWCYTTDPNVRWQLCPVYTCGSCKYNMYTISEKVFKYWHSLCDCFSMNSAFFVHHALSMFIRSYGISEHLLTMARRKPFMNQSIKTEILY